MLRPVSSYPPPPGDGPSYPPPHGGEPPWTGGHGPVPADNRSTWALVVGIVSIVLSCCCGLLSVGGGVLAIVLAQQVRKQAEIYGPRPETSTATTAFWVGVTAVIVGVVSSISTVGFVLLDSLSW